MVIKYKWFKKYVYMKKKKLDFKECHPVVFWKELNADKKPQINTISH